MSKPITSKKVVSDLWGMLQMSIDEAVLAEREACAKLCEAEGERIDASWVSCAAAIRARGEQA